MKKKIILFYFIVGISSFVYSQDKYDYNWITGYYATNDSIKHFGGNRLNFNHEGVDVVFFPLPINTRLFTSCSMSNSRGEFQFYSGGCRIYNANSQVLENGEDLNEGDFSNQNCPGSSDDYPNHNGMLSVPLPGSDSVYYLFHIRVLDDNHNELLYSIIDMNANNGHGKVTLKNQVLFGEDTLALSLSAVRHGNGRDWWIIVESRNHSIFYRFLLDPYGVHGQWVQSIPAGWIQGHIVVQDGVFSQDGSKYVQHSLVSPASFVLYDFNRCTGEMSNPTKLEVPFDTVIYPSWINFSKDSRYLYVTNSVNYLFQYDLTSSNINASVSLVDTYDNSISEYGLPINFYCMNNAPDGRIYMTSTNAVNYLHRINDPNSLGSACNFIQRDVKLAAHMGFLLPNYPNYRLYELEGSLCDTLDVEHPIVSQWRRYRDSTFNVNTIKFFDYSYYKPDSWHWNFGDGSSSAQVNPMHTYSLPGLYTVCLIVSNQYGADTLCREIQVDTVSSVTNLSMAPQLIITPNPFKDFLRVKLPAVINDIEPKFRLTDLFGRVVQEIELKNFENTIIVSTLPSGVYLWQVVCNGVVIQSGKVVKI